LSLESQELGPVYVARSFREIACQLAGVAAVILDLKQDSGLQACRQIRTAHPQVPLEIEQNVAFSAPA
jgi:DNA-binding response OmpR family regulator